MVPITVQITLVEQLYSFLNLIAIGNEQKPFKIWKKITLNMSSWVYQPTTMAGLKIFSRQITIPLLQLISNYNVFSQSIARDFIIIITLKINQWYYISLTMYTVYSIQKAEKCMIL